MKSALLIGSAGSGKTTELLSIMESAKAALGGSPFAIGFASLTRAARAEAVARASAAWGVPEEILAREGWFKTAHGVAHKMLGIQKGQLIDDTKASALWVADALKVDVRVILDDDSGYAMYAGDEAAAASLNCWEIARARIEPLQDTIKRMARTGQSPPTFAECRQFIKRYEDAKRLEQRCDFTDLLARYAGVKFEPDGFYFVEPEGILPPGVKAWIFDEAQDASALVDRVCKRLAHGPEVLWAYLAGDPFQCQPAGTPVLTASGYKAIEDLDPKTDRLISFSKKDGRFYGTGGGVTFEKAWRDVDSGDLVEVSFSDGTKSICTTNHKWLVRTTKKDVYATYLMRKGARWRVGTVQMFAKSSAATSAKNGDFRLKMRMNQEAADEAWVLRMFDTDREARMYEQVVSCRFGLPQVTFRPPCGAKNNLDSEFIDTVFGELGDLSEKGHKCLASHGLDAMFPLCTKADRAKNGSKACRFVQSVNLLPGVHSVPKLLGSFFERRKRGSGNPRGNRSIGKEAEWVYVESVRRLDAGDTVRVYSLEVERHHTYVTTNGIVTGNSIFGFGGSDAKHFMSWETEKKRVMPKSWRCPQPILELGEKCLRQMKTGYWDRGVAPADHEGEIVRGGFPSAVVPRIDPLTPTLVLARCNYALDEWADELKKRGMPFSRLKSKDNTALLRGTKALWDLEHGNPVSGDDFACAVDELPARGADGPLMIRGAKTMWRKDETKRRFDLVFPSDLNAAGMTPALEDRIRAGKWADLVTGGERWRRSAIKFGPDLATRPHIRLGTVHAAKGMEADVVVLSTNTSRRVHESQALDPEQHDEERRIEYVAVTRARRKLIVASTTADYRMNIKL